jgi:uncharacterized tellurite resistance protein B-like protein
LFDAIRNFFHSRSEAEADGGFQSSRRQVAQAALMFHVIAADGIVTKEERERLRGIVAREFSLSPQETDALIDKARDADSEAVDLYAFTSVLRRELEIEERKHIVEDLWEMVYADGSVHEFEDNIVWRIADLLGVESRDRIVMKHRVRDGAGNEAGNGDGNGGSNGEGAG